jgi:hypothetical protein
MSEERATVSPATPGRPDDRATPVVLSGGAVCTGVAGLGRVVSYDRWSPVALHAPSIEREPTANVIAAYLFISQP